MDSYMKLLLHAQLHGTENLRTLSDCVFSEKLPNTSAFLKLIDD